jgi:MFS family permease
MQLLKRSFGESESVLSIYLPAFILAMGVSIAAPALPLYAKSFDVDFGMASLVLVVNQLGATIATLPTGYFIDRWGGRKMVLAGPILTALASLLMATAHSFPELLAYRFLEGWAMQMWMIGRLEIITARGGARRGTQITGMFGMDTAGRLMGPAIGGFVAGAFGLRAPFVLYGIVAAISVIPSFFLIPEVAPSRATRKAAAVEDGTPELSYRAALMALLTWPIVMLLLGNFFAAMTRGSMFGGTLDLYAVYAYGIGPQTVGILAAVGSGVGLPLTFTTGRLMDRFGRRTTIVPGFTLLAVALVVMALSAFNHWGFATYVGVFLFARVSASAVSGSMQVIGSDTAPPGARGAFFAVWSLMRQMGSFLSPAIFAGVAQGMGFGASFVLLSVMSLATAFIMNSQIKGPGRAQPATPAEVGPPIAVTTSQA